VPAGSVISQNPTAGTQIVTGSAVALVVSSGPAQVAVPSVVGMTQTAASTPITSAGLTVGAITQSSSTTVPAGSVISQNPIAATQVNVGSAVALVVSSGPPQVAVPNVVGVPQTTATATITNASLIVGTITVAQSATVPAGSVISQSPAGATQVSAGSAVSLIVSSGSQIPVPNVVGLTQAAATTTITSAGLILGTTTTSSSTTVPAGSVISEAPAAGTLVAAGSAVAIAISTGPPLVAVPNVLGATQAWASAMITAASLTPGTVTLMQSTSVAAGLVIGQSPGAAAQIAIGSAVNLIVSSGQPSGSPQIDVSLSVDSTTFQVSTPPFSTTSPNELLVAFVASDGPPGQPETMTVSGAGLTWRLVQRANGSAGTAEVWTANAPGPLVNAVVTSKAGATVNVFHQSLTLMAFSGAAMGQVAFGSGSRNQPALALEATAGFSLVFAVGFDADKAASRTLPAGQATLREWLDKDANCTFWIQDVVNPMMSGDIALITFGAPTRDAWNMVAVEIVPF
jgi:beta-lactam-binding protein with PASTA domain